MGNMALKLPRYFHMLMKKALGRYFQVQSPYCQVAQCNQKAPIPTKMTDYVMNCIAKKKTLWPLFMDGVQLSQGYKATSRRQSTFYHSVPKTSWY